MSLTTAGKTTTTATTTASKPKIIVRQAHLYEAFQIGKVAAATYLGSALTRFLSPRADEQYGPYQAGFQARALRRMLNPRNFSVVAVEETNPNVIVAYAQFVRVGEDEGSQRQIASRKTWWLTFFAWVYSWIMPLFMRVYGGRSDSPAAAQVFINSGGFEQEASFASHPKRKNRWHAESVVVLREFQGRKIGKMLMGEVTKKAQAEGVVIALEASSEGEFLYRSVGFEMVSRFPILEGMEYGPEGNMGGFMMWKPEGFSDDCICKE